MISRCPACSARNRFPLSRWHDGPVCGKCKAPLPPPSEPVDVRSEQEFESILAGAPVPVVVDFWAAWCGPCRMVAPEVQRLAAMKAGQALVLKVDTEALPRLAQRHRIQGIPALLRFDGGQESRRVAGAQRAEGIAAGLGL